MAITEACKETIWLKGLFGELNDNLQITIVFCDSYCYFRHKRSDVSLEDKAHLCTVSFYV